MKKRFRLQSKLFLSLVLLSVALITALSLVISASYREDMERKYSDTAFNTATIVADLIDGDRVPAYRETLEKDEYYEQIRQRLQRIRSTVGVRYLYVVVPEDVQVYIWDTGEEGDSGVCDLGDREEFYGGGYEVMHAALENSEERTILVTNNQTYGYLASAYVPILDSEKRPVALASVDISLDQINHQIAHFTFLISGISFGVILLAAILYFIYIRRSLIRPITMLEEDTSHLVRDRMENLSEFRNRIQTGDELQSLGETFEGMTRELDTYIHNLESVTAEKERIGAELDLATQIQADMLPRIFPPWPERTDVDIYATMDPAKEVGGDFYDFFLVDKNHLALVMADVSGKGVPAALFMVIAKTLIKNRAQQGDDPSRILENVNNQLCEGNEAELFVTVWLAIVDLRTGKGLAANAGHEHPVLRRANGAWELVEYRHSVAVAAMEGLPFRQHEFELFPGDSLFVYTDGVPEATNAENELFGTDRMLAALNSEPDATPEKLIGNVRREIDAFVREAPQFDDITMMSVRYWGPMDGKEAGEEEAR